MKPALIRFSALLLITATSATCPAADVRQMLQTADYVGVDYAGAVQDGQIVSEVEYAEMREFAAILADSVAELPPGAGREALSSVTAELRAAVQRKAPAPEISDLTRQISALLNRWYPLQQVPEQVPDLDLGARSYADRCAACHGVEGQGDGPAAAALDPAPTNFRDPERASQRSLYGLYNTITLGVPGTAMSPFAALAEHERWSLAFYVASLHETAPDASAFARIARSVGAVDLATSSEAILQSAYGPDGPAALAWLRRHPEALLDLTDSRHGAQGGLAVARRQLHASLAAWRAGDIAQAERLALSAYLDGFELVEPTLGNVDAALMRETEKAMSHWRAVLRDGDAAQIEAAFASANELLDSSERALGGGALAAGVTFLSALVILIREGLEAVLLVVAMLVMVRRADVPLEIRSRSLRALHAGWILALVAGLATWMISNWLIAISGAMRELTEGVTALLAAAVLLWVGLWMHGQAAVRHWSHFVGEGISRAVGQRSTWLLLGLSFLSVYRELFEIVLFYQALWLQVDRDGQMLVLAGIGVALLALGLLTWFIMKASQRLPLKTFFTICAYSVLVLAVIFAGKGIAALQEAGRVPISPLNLPTIEIIGLYPSAEGLLLQLTVFVLAFVWLLRQHRAGSRARAKTV